MEGLTDAFTGPLDPEAQARVAQARASSLNHLRADLSRMNRDEAARLKSAAWRSANHAAGERPNPSPGYYEGLASIQPGMAEQAAYGYRPGEQFGHQMSMRDDAAGDRIAGVIESQYGTLESTPSWRNADDYARAGAEYARQNSDRHFGSTADAYTASKQLLSPEQYDYMQGVGRTVDLLKGLRETPVTAAKFYKDSYQEPLARKGMNEASYQRFAGPEKAAADFFQSPAGAVPWYLRVANSVPSAIRSMGDRASTAAVNAAGAREFSQRFGMGDVKVLDLPSDATTQEYLQRLAEVQQLGSDIQPPSWHQAVNAVPVLPNVPPAMADAIGVFGEAVDPSLAAGILAGIPIRMAASSPAKVLAGLAGTGQLANRLANATGREVVDQMIPEIAFAGGTGSVQASIPSERSWWDYFTPSEAGERDPEAATRATNVLQALNRSGDNDIWNARRRHDPNRPRQVDAREADVGAMY